MKHIDNSLTGKANLDEKRVKVFMAELERKSLAVHSPLARSVGRSKAFLSCFQESSW